jgi:hypothetical protein
MKKILVLILALTLGAHSAFADSCAVGLMPSFSWNQAAKLCATFPIATTANTTLKPATDNLLDLGATSFSWRSIYYGTSRIAKTSDILRVEQDAQRLFTWDASSDTAFTQTWGDGGTTSVQQFSILASTADADDDSSLILGAGGAATASRGGFLSMAGNETAGDGDVTLSTGSDSGSDLSLVAAGSSSVLRATISGTTDTLQATSTSNTVTKLTYGDAGVTAAQTFLLGPSTPDTDDDSITYIGSIADVTRGGYLKVNGNEASGAGDIVIDSGDASGSAIFIRTNHSGGTITFSTAASTTALTLNSDQTATLVGQLTAPGMLVPAANEEAVAGAGTTVADAAALSATKHIHQITGANGTVGWKFASSTAGQVEWLLSTTAGVPKVYAVSGGTCNGGAADAACTLLSGITVHMCYATAANAWICA